MKYVPQATNDIIWTVVGSPWGLLALYLLLVNLITFLVFGLDKQWYLAHPDVMEMELPERLKFMMECGALVIQAHPFREGTPMSLYHRCVQGVEVINANYMATYQLVKLYCEHYDLLPFAGSDNHYPAKKALLAGIACRERITSVEDMIQKAKNRQLEIFSQEVSPCI